MALLEKHLFLKRSTMPSAGKGLFTKQDIKRGTFIVEYKGVIRKWKELKQGEGCNGYMYYINRNHVIDAKPSKQCFGRYANDANGIGKLKGMTNNVAFSISDNKVFIKAIKNIKAAKKYWFLMEKNIGMC